MLVPMARMELIGPKNIFLDVLTALHEAGTLHIEDLTKKIDAGELPLEHMEVVENQAVEQERMEELLIRLRSIIKALHLPPGEADEVERQKHYLQLWQMDAKELAAEVTNVIDQVEDRTSSLAQAQFSMARNLWTASEYFLPKTMMTAVVSSSTSVETISHWLLVIESSSFLSPSSAPL